MAVAPVVHLLITVGAIVWGGFLGRGDLPVSVMAGEYLVILAYPGFLVATARVDPRPGGGAAPWGR